jgi:hypothetical protein
MVILYVRSSSHPRKVPDPGHPDPASVTPVSVWLAAWRSRDSNWLGRAYSPLGFSWRILESLATASAHFEELTDAHCRRK